MAAKGRGGENPELQVTDHGSDTACMQTGRGGKIIHTGYDMNIFFYFFIFLTKRLSPHFSLTPLKKSTAVTRERIRFRECAAQLRGESWTFIAEEMKFSDRC